MEPMEDEAIQQFIIELKEASEKFKAERNYVQAEIALNRLEELKLHEESRRRDALRSRQLADRQKAEEANQIEIQEFNTMWDKKIALDEEQAEAQVQKMKEKHSTEFRIFQEEQTKRQSLLKPKFSAELLNLRRIEETLANKKDFAEAQKVKVKSDGIEAWETERWISQLQQEANQNSAKFMAEKQKELLALQKRILAERDKLKKQRQIEYERLLQKHINAKKELEGQYNQERIKLEKGNLSTSKVVKRVNSAKTMKSPKGK